MLKKMASALLLTAALVCPALTANAAISPASGTTTITPNTLTIAWDDASKAEVTINTFRIFDYNVAQLRTMVGALGGTTKNLADGTYQLSPAVETSVPYSPVIFSGVTTVDYIVNTTPIRNSDGALVRPEQPGWVLLPAYGYNWASIRDVAAALKLEIVSVTDDSVTGTKVVVKAPATPTPTPLPANADAGPAANPPSSGTIYGPSVDVPVSTPTPTPLPNTNVTVGEGAVGAEVKQNAGLADEYSYQVTIVSTLASPYSVTFAIVEVTPANAGKSVASIDVAALGSADVSSEKQDDGIYRVFIDGAVTNPANISVTAILN